MAPPETHAAPTRPRSHRRAPRLARSRPVRLAAAGLVFSAVVATPASGAARTAAADGSPALRTVATGAATVSVPGFLREAGRYRTVAVPGTVTETFAASINNRGQIAGGYDLGTARDFHGFIRDRRGRITRVDVPGAAGTTITKINDRGSVVGNFSATNPDPQQGTDTRGFLLDRGRFVRIAVPGAARTQAFGLNDRGQVVGQYNAADGTIHGYLWQDGRYTTIDRPGAAGTATTDINNRGQIIGAYADAAGVYHGFLLEQRRYTTFDVPGAPYSAPYDINNRGQIVGIAGVPDQEIHGFLLADGVGGRPITIEFPGSAATFAFGLNDLGQIVGTYTNANATPAPQAVGDATNDH